MPAWSAQQGRGAQHATAACQSRWQAGLRLEARRRPTPAAPPRPPCPQTRARPPRPPRRSRRAPSRRCAPPGAEAAAPAGGGSGGRAAGSRPRAGSCEWSHGRGDSLDHCSSGSQRRVRHHCRRMLSSAHRARRCRCPARRRRSPATAWCSTAPRPSSAPGTPSSPASGAGQGRGGILQFSCRKGACHAMPRLASWSTAGGATATGRRLGLRHASPRVADEGFSSV